jgi:nitrogen regulatory protein PII
MKRIDAVIRQQNLSCVKHHLSDIGVEGLTVTEVKGTGQQKRTEFYRGTAYNVEFLPMLLLTILADDEQIPEIVDAIVKGARTGKVGDGKIFVSQVEEIVRIRNGQIGRAALGRTNGVFASLAR